MDRNVSQNRFASQPRDRRSIPGMSRRVSSESSFSLTCAFFSPKQRSAIPPPHRHHQRQSLSPPLPSHAKAMHYSAEGRRKIALNIISDSFCYMLKGLHVSLEAPCQASANRAFFPPSNTSLTDTSRRGNPVRRNENVPEMR